MPSMLIICEGCGARFRMDPALFRNATGARIRCRKCGGPIEVRFPGAASVPGISANVETEPSMEAPENVPGLKRGDAPPEGEPTPPRCAPSMEPVSPPEEPSFPQTVTDEAPEPDSSPEEREAEMALKRRLRASHRRLPSTLTVLVLVVTPILLLTGGVFLLRNTKPAQDLLHGFSRLSRPGNAARAVRSAGSAGKTTYEIRESRASYTKTFVGGNLFVIRGTVANVGKGPSRGIRVQATLLDKNNRALVSNTVFAANLVDNTMLRHAERGVIERFLGMRYGEGNANRDIPAGKTLPFMVVFFDPPGHVEYFTVKALSAEER